MKLPYAKQTPKHTSLYQLCNDVNYLEDNPNIYDVNAVTPVDDPVQVCLEELYKQIINQ